MGVEEEVKLARGGDGGVDHGAGVHVARLVAVRGAGGQQARVVVLECDEEGSEISVATAFLSRWCRGLCGSRIGN